MSEALQIQKKKEKKGEEKRKPCRSEAKHALLSNILLPGVAKKITKYKYKSK